MFLSVSTFLQAWEKEAESTQRILDALTDDSLNQLVAAQDRTLGRIAWHLVTTIPEMMARGLESNRNGATSSIVNQGIVVGAIHELPLQILIQITRIRGKSNAYTKQ